jgi:hypothetical protein
MHDAAPIIGRDALAGREQRAQQIMGGGVILGGHGALDQGKPGFGFLAARRLHDRADGDVDAGGRFAAGKPLGTAGIGRDRLGGEAAADAVELHVAACAAEMRRRIRRRHGHGRRSSLRRSDQEKPRQHGADPLRLPQLTVAAKFSLGIAGQPPV